MFGYASVSLTEIETIYAFMAAHTKVVPDVVLFFTGDIIEQENRLWAGFVWRDHLFMIRERQEINTLYVIQHAFQYCILGLVDGFGVDIEIRESKTVGMGQES